MHLDLSYHLFKKILSSSGLMLTSEVEVFNALEDWVSRDEERRKEFAVELVRKVRLHLLSKAILDSLLAGKSCLLKNTECRDYIENVRSNKVKGLKFKNAGASFQNRYCAQENFNVFVSGYTQKNQNIYKFKRLNLTEAPKLIEIKRDFYGSKTVSVNEKIYFLGHSSMYYYSILTKQWSEIINFPRQRRHYCACNFMNKIYFLGGEILLHNMAFDTATEKWEKLPEMEQNIRMAAGCAVFGSSIFVTGGKGLYKRLKSVERYDGHSWSGEIPDMLMRRCRHSCVVTNGKMYVVGGQTSSCEVYDGFSFAHVTGNSPHCKSPVMIGMSCVAVGGKIVAYSGMLHRFVVYDCDKEKWSDLKFFQFSKFVDVYEIFKMPML